MSPFTRCKHIKGFAEYCSVLSLPLEFLPLTWLSNWTKLHLTSNHPPKWESCWWKTRTKSCHRYRDIHLVHLFELFRNSMKTQFHLAESYGFFGLTVLNQFPPLNPSNLALITFHFKFWATAAGRPFLWVIFTSSWLPSGLISIWCSSFDSVVWFRMRLVGCGFESTKKIHSPIPLSVKEFRE